MTRLFNEAFDGFTANGFAPEPGAGQLDSDVWRVVGLSDNANPAFGFTGPSGGDFGRGVIATNDPTTAGVYSPAIDNALVIQPTGAELDTNGFIEARILNTSGATANDFTIDFDWVARNSAPRSDNLSFSYSTDGTTFTDVPAAAFSSPAAAMTGATFTETAVSPITLSGLAVPAGGDLYLRWTHVSSAGSGNRDEVGIDNVVVDTTAGGTTPVGTTVSIDNVSVTEGDTGTKTATFTVTRSDTAGAFSVHYATADGTATMADGDYMAASGDLSFAAGGPASQTVSVTVDGDTKVEGSETFSVQLSALTSTSGTAALGAATGTGTIVDDDVTVTPIYAIQGSDAASPLAGQIVTTRGVVTAISTGSTKGFYVQDATGDGNAATSDAVFVFTGSTPTVAEGDLVSVTGTVQEYRPNGAARGALATTELSSVTQVTTVSSGNALPAAVVIGIDGRAVPTSDITAANVFFESLEGMLVTVENPLVVGPTNNFGEIFTVASGGTGATGLNGRGDLLISGGTANFGFTDTAGGDLNPERIQIDPGLGVTLPNVSTGALLASVTGVVGYDFGDYQVLAKTAPTVVQASPLTKAAATLFGDADHLLVGSYNTENLDPGDGAARFATVASEIVGKLNSPDIVALQEIQDNNGPTDNGVTSASTTLQTIVDAINAAGGPQYAYVDNPFIGNDTNGGEPGGNIRTAFIYRTDRVSFEAGSLATVATDGSAITSGSYTDQQTNPDNPFYDSRPPLAATFTFNGQSVTVLSNHFTSKGGSGALYGSEQPPFDGGEVQRAGQAQAVNSFVDGVLAADPTARVVVAGDLNDFGFEQPLSVLRGVATVTNYDVPGTNPIAATATYTPGGAAVLNDLQDTLPADQRFDYVYEGNAETLDHMLVTNALAAGAQFQPVHINAEFFDQTSDHDPLVASFVIPAPPAQSTGLNILLTNDDGYDAPGIRTLYAALVSAGFNVHIVAPAMNQSAQGSSLGGVSALNSPINITQFSPGNYYVDGRPDTTTLAGIDDLFAGNPPDLVISGTNRGDNTGESENISGTVNGAIQAMFEGIPSIAVSAGSASGSYTDGFNNAANFTVDFLHQLQAAQAAGQPILPTGQALSINVPGAATLAGVSVTTVTPESSATYPYAPTASGTYAEGFIPNTAPSGSSTAEGSQFLTNHITISPLDGNWGSTEADRSDLAIRLGSQLNSTPTVAKPLNILLLDEDGYNAPGIVATRDALLAKGYNVTVLAPTTDQSAVGSALFLLPVTVTQYDAKNYAATGTPASLVALALDPQGLLNGVRPDLVVVGADQGDAVGVENATHSATVGGAITALFNYAVPSVALTLAGNTAADLATGTSFLTTLIGNLQATQGTSPTILPQGVGLSINVPRGATASNYAFTTIDAATDANLSVAGDATVAQFVDGGVVTSTAAHSEGNAFNAGKITVSPIDGNFAVRDSAAYDALASLVGTTFGTSTAAPTKLSFTVSEDAYQGDAQFVVTVNGKQIGGAQTVTALHGSGQSQTVTVLDFFDSRIDQVGVDFINDAYGGNAVLDRNLYVSSLSLNGAVYQATSPANPDDPLLNGSAALLHAGSVTFATADTLTFRVSEDAYKGDAQFVVKVGGVQVGGVQTVTASHAAGAYQDVTLTGNFGEPSTVSIDFINDAYDGSPALDRNLYVDSLTVNGANYDDARAQGGNTVKIDQSTVLNQNGSLTFMTKDTLNFQVSEDSYQGDAVFVVAVNGYQVGGLHSVTALHSAGQTQDVTLQGLFGDIHDVTINFTNDAYGGSPSLDRNLYVDKLTVNGTNYASSSAINTAGDQSGNSAVLMNSNGNLSFYNLG